MVFIIILISFLLASCIDEVKPFCETDGTYFIQTMKKESSKTYTLLDKIKQQYSIVFYEDSTTLQTDAGAWYSIKGKQCQDVIKQIKGI